MSSTNTVSSPLELTFNESADLLNVDLPENFEMPSWLCKLLLHLGKADLGFLQQCMINPDPIRGPETSAVIILREIYAICLTEQRLKEDREANRKAKAANALHNARF